MTPEIFNVREERMTSYPPSKLKKFLPSKLMNYIGTYTKQELC